MQMHLDLHDIDWRHDLVYPLALIAVPMVASVIGAGEWLIMAFPVAIVAGYLFAPRYLWMVWLGAIVMLWTVYGTANLLNIIEPLADDPSQGETWWTFALESFVFMAGLVWLPVTIGRLLKRVIG